jgi:hypothetical protein
MEHGKDGQDMNFIKCPVTTSKSEGVYGYPGI